LPTGSSAAAAGCEARSAEHPADGNPRRLLPGAERPATTSWVSCRQEAQRIGGQLHPIVRHLFPPDNLVQF